MVCPTPYEKMIAFFLGDASNIPTSLDDADVALFFPLVDKQTLFREGDVNGGMGPSTFRVGLPEKNQGLGDSIRRFVDDWIIRIFFQAKFLFRMGDLKGIQFRKGASPDDFSLEVGVVLGK